MFFLYKPVQLVNAKKVLLQDRKFGQIFEENIIREKSQNSGEVDLYFINKKNKYIWDEGIQMFRKLTNIDETLNQSDFYKMQGLSPNDVRERLRVSLCPLSLVLIISFQRFGSNIIKISVPPVIHLIIHEVSLSNLPMNVNSIFATCLQGLNPFFLFQAYTVILWTLQWYWKFALIIAVTTVITVTLSVWETRKVWTRQGFGDIYS